MTGLIGLPAAGHEAVGRSAGSVGRSADARHPLRPTDTNVVAQLPDVTTQVVSAQSSAPSAAYDRVLAPCSQGDTSGSGDGAEWYWTGWMRFQQRRSGRRGVRVLGLKGRRRGSPGPCLGPPECAFDAAFAAAVDGPQRDRLAEGSCRPGGMMTTQARAWSYTTPRDAITEHGASASVRGVMPMK